MSTGKPAGTRDGWQIDEVYGNDRFLDPGVPEVKRCSQKSVAYRITVGKCHTRAASNVDFTMAVWQLCQDSFS